MKLGDCQRYMLGIMLINRLESGKRITEEEKRRFVDIMEDKNRKPKKEDIIFKAFKKEYAKSKIEGKRKVTQEETSAFFVRK